MMATRDEEQQQIVHYQQRIADLEILEGLRVNALNELHMQLESLSAQNQELRLAQDNLIETERRYRDLFDYGPVAHYLLDKTGAVTESNLAGCDLLQENRLRLLRRPLQIYLAKPHRDAFSLYLANAAVSDQVITLDVEIEGRKGCRVLVQLYMVVEILESQQRFRVVAVPISWRRQNDDQVQLAATVFEENREGVMITDAIGKILHVNPAFTVITGYTNTEVTGKNPSLLASGRHDKAFFVAMWEQLSREGHWQGEIWNKRKNGEIYPEWLKISTIYGRDRQVRNRVGIFKDISELRQDGNINEHYAFYDILTELPNRSLFVERLKHALIRAQRDKKQVALMYLDLDRFKQVNDVLGHPTGDILLQMVAARLSQQVRSNDTVARLGGDEFAIIISELGDVESAEIIAQRIAQQICIQLASAFQIGDHEILIGSSIGIAYFPQQGQTYSELIKHADLAMYKAKSQGGGRYATFSQDMSEQLQYRVLLEASVRNALRRDELRLVYQPIVNAKTQNLLGVEVLLRWDGPNGPVAPMEFIPICEELGLGGELAHWVLRRACQELSGMPFWQRSESWFSINISPQVIHRNHIDWLTQVLAEFQIPPQRMVIEVTEEHLRHDAESAIKVLSNVRALGIRVAIDDFGTGYSSFGRLRDFPIDILKIDRSFIQGLGGTSSDLAIVVTIITLANELNLEFLAEGVETQQQLQQLIAKGCLNIQGYVFAKPMSAQLCDSWHDDWQNRVLPPQN
jgi:diguanylate cyclase (GGDEF)-like protein/PAS domain S-box-containing protein